jgi:hypothetical protein
MGRFGDPACSILLRSANKAGIFSKKLHLERTFKTTERVDAFETGRQRTRSLAMSEIPLHLQRRFEQRWAARFVPPVAAVAPKSIVLKDTVNSLQRAADAKEEPAGLSQRAVVERRI